AEASIRDFHVTGVQTCALPICGGRPSRALAVTMMIVSPLVALLWRYFGLHEHIYEGMPGILTGLLVYSVGARLGSAPADENAARSEERRVGEKGVGRMVRAH